MGAAGNYRGITLLTVLGKVQYRSDARYNEPALRTRLRVQANAFARSRERVCAFKETRLRVQANAFELSRKRVGRSSERVRKM